MKPSNTLTLRRSCFACIKSKRRCDLQLPQCIRCSSRDLQCVYANEPLTSHNVAFLESVSTNTSMPASRGVSKHNVLTKRHGAYDRYVETVQPFHQQFPSPVAVSSVNLHQLPLMQGLRVTIDTPTIHYLGKKLQDFVASFIREHKTPFIHSDSYGAGLPKIVNDMHLTCLAYASKTRSNQNLIYQILRHKTTELKCVAQNNSSFDEMIAAVQALILAYTICQFDIDPCLPSLADEQIHYIVTLTDQIWLLAPSQVFNDLTPRQAWLYAESVRRTIIMAHLLKDLYCVLKHGYFIHTLFGEALPFDARSTLWDAQSVDSWEAHGAKAGSCLISWRELCEMFEQGQTFGSFETLLLVACRGKGQVEASGCL